MSIKADLEVVWNWLTAEIAVAATVVKPILSEIAAEAKADLLTDDSNALIAIQNALAGGASVPTAILTAFLSLMDTAKAQAISLSEEALMLIATGLVAKAKAGLSSASGTSA